MKTSRKAASRRKAVRRPAPLTISQRVERLEKELLFKPGTTAAVKAITQRFVNLDQDGKPTTGEHVAVYDRLTGLTWAAAPVLDGKTMNHAAAMKVCADLELMGQKDWRASTITELLGIVEYESYDPAVNKAHFKGPYGWTWTSTPFKGNSGAAWGVDLDYGLSYWFLHSLGYHARAVRAGQPLGLLE